MPRRGWVCVRLLARRAHRVGSRRGALRVAAVGVAHGGGRARVGWNVAAVLERFDVGALPLLLLPTRLAVGVDAPLCEEVGASSGQAQGAPAQPVVLASSRISRST